MLQLLSTAILWMGGLRILSGSIEILAGLLILKFNQIDKALLINACLALVGPIIMITSVTIGLVGLSDKVSFGKILWILAGVGCILIGVKSK
jgi:uncharacterized membrane protein HdeD (DUF308 family)